MPATGFHDLVAERTGTGYVERPWLTAAIEQSVVASRFTLLTGEPGAGKTTVLAGLAQRHPDWLPYFVRRDSVTALVGADLTGFLLEIGHQLARSRPELFEAEPLDLVVKQRVKTAGAGSRVTGIRIDDLIASPFHRTASYHVDQEIRRGDGDVTGIAISRAHVEPRLLEAGVLTELALGAPAALLAERDPQARIVILLDAVDELVRDPRSGLLDWLIRGPELPANVRLVLAARPVTDLAALRSARTPPVPAQRGTPRPLDELTEVVIPADSRQVREDLLGYARSTLDTAAVRTAVAADGQDWTDFLDATADHAAGNFQVLTAYAKALTDVSTRDRDPVLLAGLLRFRGIAPGLPGLYTFFLDTIRRDVDGLGRVELDGVWTAEVFESVGRTVLGMLAVARAPLSAAEIARLSGLPAVPRVVGAVLSRMGWLLRTHGDRFAFYHASIAEFLAGPDARMDWSVDPHEWHEKIVRACRGGRPTLADVDWTAAGDYELVHVADHLSAAGRDTELPGLVSPGLRRAVRARFANDRYFVRVVDLALARSLDRATDLSALPDVLFLSVTRAELSRAGGRLGPPVLGLAARLGRVDEALEHAWALPPSAQQAAALAEIATHAPAGRSRELAELAAAQASTLKDLPGHTFRDAAVKAAALLAPHDLDRALALWAKAGTQQPPDPVYAAAGDAVLLARMSAGRTAACLDAAETTADPQRRSALLLLAESGLDLLPGEQRVTALARLARLDPAGALRHRDALRREADRLEVGRHHPNEVALATAAAELAGIDDALARALLDRLAAVRAVPENRARALAALGRPDEGRLLLFLRLMENPPQAERIRIAEALVPLDPDGGHRLVDQLATELATAPPPRDLITVMQRGSAVADVARLLLDRDPDRAEELALHAPEDHHSPFLTDPATVLAGLAHRHLDAGRTDRARTLLGGLLTRSEWVAPLREPDVGVPWAPADGHPGEEAASLGAMLHWQYRFNIENQWRRRIHRRLYTDPAHLLQSLPPGPASIGTPHSLARTLRVYADRLSRTDPPRAAALAALIDDAGEAAVAQAALVSAAILARDPDGEQRAWQSLRHLIVRMPGQRWASAGPEADRDFLAYLRPDYRSRFDAAVSLLPYEADPGLAMLTDLPALSMVFQLAFAAGSSTLYTSQRLAGRDPDPSAAQIHDSVRRDPAGALPEPVLAAVLAAVVSVNEQILGGAELDVPDPVYRLYARVTASATRAALTGRPGVPVSVGQLDGARLPAYAEIVRANAGSPVVTELAAAVLSVAGGTGSASPGSGGSGSDAPHSGGSGSGRASEDVEALLILAAAGYGDPGPLLDRVLDDPKRGPFLHRPLGQEIPDDLLPDLSVLLFRHDPGRALRFLSEATARGWAYPAAILEHVADELLEASGPEIGEALHAAVSRAVTCTALRDDDLPPVIDGVRRIPAE
ncbi:hypothetical protein [Actinoplanes sp. NBRC 101535]|uniref:hypothetical protein n=1 Tax=Actinoplanes sp. NBRC 101535 TaxID=3032196 RepID=UPI0024A50C70|nr:hypothetical protein [Actinoplanes sp. NBRC 101535]GLY00616.1 hypothetical protein Acsp01_09950 [Actinoplanes sp. NBRC 101535]